MSFPVPGDFMPDFIAPSSVNPNFNFSTVAGRQFVMVFLASAQCEVGRRLLDAVIAESAWLRARRTLVYVVTVDPRDRESGPLSAATDRFVVFWDFDRTIHSRYRMLVPAPVPEPETARPATSATVRVGAMVVRENLRLHAWVPAAPLDGFAARLRSAAESMPLPEAPRPAGRHAPVLVVPDVIDRDHCRRLIDHYDSRGGEASGFMRDVDGRTLGLMDEKMKRRRDCYIEDQALIQPLLAALRTRLAPEIHKAFGYRATRIERYLIGCYDESDRGFFRAHRDNTSKGTAHRAFAVSLNLNSEEYEGGHLTFPEYGSALYKPETGAAVVFSCSLLHEATPVTRGRRYVVLPFLYDERGAAIRAQNRKFLGQEQAAAGDQTAA